MTCRKETLTTANHLIAVAGIAAALVLSQQQIEITLAGEIKAVIVAAAINLRLSIGLQHQRLITAGAFKIVAG